MCALLWNDKHHYSPALDGVISISLTMLAGPHFTWTLTTACRTSLLAALPVLMRFLSTNVSNRAQVAVVHQLLYRREIVTTPSHRGRHFALLTLSSQAYQLLISLQKPDGHLRPLQSNAWPTR